MKKTHYTFLGTLLVIAMLIGNTALSKETLITEKTPTVAPKTLKKSVATLPVALNARVARAAAFPGGGEGGGGEGGGGSTSTPSANDTIQIGLNAQNSLTAETTDLLGEQIDLNTGALSFSNTDVVLPGNNHIRMAIGRTHHGSSFSYYNRSDFGDWALDIPHIRTNTIIASTMAGPWGRGKECSGEPDNETLHGIRATEYYNGEHLHVPGQVSEQLVYRGVKKTKSHWKVTCIQQGSGEIFSIQSPSGDTYIFSHKVIKL